MNKSNHLKEITLALEAMAKNSKINHKTKFLGIKIPFARFIAQTIILALAFIIFISGISSLALLADLSRLGAEQINLPLLYTALTTVISSSICFKYAFKFLVKMESLLKASKNQIKSIEEQLSKIILSETTYKQDYIDLSHKFLALNQKNILRKDLFLLDSKLFDKLADSENKINKIDLSKILEMEDSLSIDILSNINMEKSNG